MSQFQKPIELGLTKKERIAKGSNQNSPRSYKGGRSTRKQRTNDSSSSKQRVVKQLVPDGELCEADLMDVRVETADLSPAVNNVEDVEMINVVVNSTGGGGWPLTATSSL